MVEWYTLAPSTSSTDKPSHTNNMRDRRHQNQYNTNQYQWIPITWDHHRASTQVTSRKTGRNLTIEYSPNMPLHIHTYYIFIHIPFALGEGIPTRSPQLLGSSACAAVLNGWAAKGENFEGEGGCSRVSGSWNKAGIGLYFLLSWQNIKAGGNCVSLPGPRRPWPSAWPGRWTPAGSFCWTGR